MCTGTNELSVVFAVPEVLVLYLSIHCVVWIKNLQAKFKIFIVSFTVDRIDQSVSKYYNDRLWFIFMRLISNSFYEQFIHNYCAVLMYNSEKKVID